MLLFDPCCLVAHFVPRTVLTVLYEKMLLLFSVWSNPYVRVERQVLYRVG